MIDSSTTLQYLILLAVHGKNDNRDDALIQPQSAFDRLQTLRTLEDSWKYMEFKLSKLTPSDPGHCPSLAGQQHAVMYSEHSEGPTGTPNYRWLGYKIAPTLDHDVSSIQNVDLKNTELGLFEDSFIVLESELLVRQSR